MVRLGFSNKWIKWNLSCLTSTMISILVNGSPISEFVPEKGLRQDNPLVTFLFLIIVEGL